MLDGAARVEAPRSNPSAPTIFSEAARDGMSAIAVTDHGAMFGALRFYEAARKAGVKPIMGVEAYVAPGSRFDRTPGESEERHSMRQSRQTTVLAGQRPRGCSKASWLAIVVVALATLLLAASLTLIALAFAVPIVVRRTRLAVRARRLAEG